MTIPISAAARAPSPRQLPRIRTTTLDPLLAVLFGYILVTVWRVQDLYPMLGVVRVPLLIAGLSIFLFLVDRAPLRKIARIDHSLLWLCLAMGVAVFASGVFGAWAGNTLRFLVNDFVKTLMLMVLLAASIRNPDDLRRLAVVQVLGGTLYCILILMRFSVGAGGRLGALVYYDANDLAMMLVVTLPLGVLLTRFGATRGERIIAGLTLPIFLVTIVKTGSRGGFLGLIAVTLFLLFGFRALSRRVRAVGVALGVLGFVLFAGGRYWSMMSTIVHPSADYNYAGNARGGRMEIWKRGMGYLEQYPVFGVGARNFGFAERNLGQSATLRRMGVNFRDMAPHNSYVEIAAETGLVGFSLFIAMLVVAFRAAWRIGRRGSSFESALGQCLVGSLIGYCVAGFFLTQAFAAILYVLFAAALALNKLVPLPPGATMAASLHSRAVFQPEPTHQP